MEKEDLQQLLDKYLREETDLKEDQVVESLIFDQQVKSGESAESARSRKIVWTKLRSSLHSKRAFKLQHWCATAAAIVILFGAGIILWQQKGDKNSISVSGIRPGKQVELPPLSNTAILTLDNGKQIALNKNKSGLVMVGDSLSYSDHSEIETDVQATDSKYLQIYAPKGGGFNVILSDGTKVFLNADSRLSYPISFEGKERIVLLEGEAYFEVNEVNDTKIPNRKLPFIVKSEGQEVRVLGTKFNVNAYNKRIKTTLVSGRVKVQTNDGKAVFLIPGEQADQSASQLSKATVDIRRELAWRENKFNFDNKPFPQIMEELARWYGLDVRYEGDVPRVRLTGDAIRKQNIRLVLRILDAVEVKYHLDGKNRILYILQQ